MSKVSKVRSVIAVLYILVLGISVQVPLYGASSAQQSQKKKPSLTVVVHGTYWPALGVTNPLQIFTGAIANDSSYARLLGLARTNSLLYEASFMLDVGFTPIARSILEKIDKNQLSRAERSSGAYFIAHAYDAVASKAGFDTSHEQYACFGWPGMLSHEARTLASEQLYKKLCQIRGEYDQIRLIGYSHGGNIIVKLEEQERIQRKKLVIDTAVFWGCPMQIETAAYLNSPLFKSIISLFSRGDFIQTADIVTRGLESFRTMHELHDLERIRRANASLHRCDVELLVNNAAAIDHFNMFTLGMKSVHQYFGVLPAIILTPLIIKHTQSQPGYTALQLHIRCFNDTVTTSLAGLPTKRGVRPVKVGSASGDLHALIKHEQELIEKQWVSRFDIAKTATGQLWQSIKQILAGPA